MSFKVIWTGANGSEEIEVGTAADALREYEARNKHAIKLVIKDNHRRKVTPNELATLAAMAARSGTT